MKSLLQAAEKSCYAELFADCGNNLIKTWKVIKGILYGYFSPTLPSRFTRNGTLVTENIKIANNFKSVLDLILLQKFLPLPPTLKISCLAEPHTPLHATNQ